MLVNYFATKLEAEAGEQLDALILDIAKDVKQVKDLVVGRYMIDYNEVEGLVFDGFPDVRFYPKANKTGEQLPMDESDEVGAQGKLIYTKDGIMKYLKENSSAF